MYLNLYFNYFSELFQLLNNVPLTATGFVWPSDELSRPSHNATVRFLCDISYVWTYRDLIPLQWEWGSRNAMCFLCTTSPHSSHGLATLLMFELPSVSYFCEALLWNMLWLNYIALHNLLNDLVLQARPAYEKRRRDGSRLHIRSACSEPRTPCLMRGMRARTTTG